MSQRISQKLCRGPKGFTLLEMLIVLAISTLMLGFIAPNLYKVIAGTDLSSTTKELAVALRQARLKAVTTSRPVSLVLDVDKHTYRLSTQTAVLSLANTLELSLLTGKSFLEGQQKGAIFFYPDGSSSGGRITLKLEHRSQQIDISWLTGGVSVQQDASS